MAAAGVSGDVARAWGLRLCEDTALPDSGTGLSLTFGDAQMQPRLRRLRRRSIALASFSAQSVCSGCAVTSSLYLLSRARRSPTAWERVGSLLALLESTVGEGSALSAFPGAHAAGGAVRACSP